MEIVRRVAPSLIAILLVAAFVSAVLLSNTSEFRGPISGGVITIGPIGSAALSLHNGTEKAFAWNVTNEVNRTVPFNLSISFFMSGVVHGGFTILSFDWTLDGLLLNNTEDSGEGLTPSWHDFYLTSLGPFATRIYTLVITFSFIGAGDYTLRVSALET